MISYEVLDALVRGEVVRVLEEDGYCCEYWLDGDVLLMARPGEEHYVLAVHQGVREVLKFVINACGRWLVSKEEGIK